MARPHARNNGGSDHVGEGLSAARRRRNAAAARRHAEEVATLPRPKPVDHRVAVARMAAALPSKQPTT